MSEPARDRNGTIIFPDYPDFAPNKTPREIFASGAMGGTYWRPIYSNVTKRNYSNLHLKFPHSWWLGIPGEHLVKPYDQYDKSINKYGVKVGLTLQEWESHGWIKEPDVYGWIQWYCEFYRGRRSADDERQIKRWQQTAGPNSRFRLRLIHMIRDAKKKYDDASVSPKIRQTLLHWGYELTERDFKSAN